MSSSTLRRKHRKRNLILETKIQPNPKPRALGSHQRSFFPSFSEPLRSDRFIVELENDSKELAIPSERIMSFKFVSDADDNKKIEITSLLEVDDWLDDFIEINICKIYLLDNRGDVIRYYDYDVAHCGHEYELTYSDSDVLTPKIYYVVFD
jgi:hypothetical protein